jgi:hypothetical protein
LQPIPLSLVNLGDFSGNTIKTTTSLTGGLISRKDKNEQASTPEQESRTVYPFTYVVKSSGAMGGTYVLWADSEAARTEWRDKLQEAKTLSDVVSDSNKVFELGELSKGTLVKSNTYAPAASTTRAPTEPSPFAGQVTCSVPFRACLAFHPSLSQPKHSSLISFPQVLGTGGVWSLWAVTKVSGSGCGTIWRPSARSCMVSSDLSARPFFQEADLSFLSISDAVKNVTQVACLEEFSIFLVLADHSLFAYQLDALVPSSASAASSASRGPERLSGTAHVLFFSVGQLSGRTLVA